MKYSEALLKNRSMEEAQSLQFKMVDEITKEFTDNEFYQLGDVGLHPDFGRPQTTAKAERVLAQVFDSEACALVRGSGTGAIRLILAELVAAGDTCLVHTAPMYMTTKETFRQLGLKQEAVDYNDLSAFKSAVAATEAKLVYVQHARQAPHDTYQLGEVIEAAKTIRPDLPVVVDDNYCAFKMPKIGCEYGADYSTFSGFKLLGPEGIGVIVGKAAAIERLHARNYSGGGQVQGHEAHELLRSLTLAPVMLATQNEQVEELYQRIKNGALPGVEDVYMVNAQSKNVMIELAEPIASQVIANAARLGAATYPVGAESRYELAPMVYRPSGSFREADPKLEKHGLRVNPMKSSASTVLRILHLAVKEAQKG
ncbi:aminotransferase class V-fold PLP-dependent enzyme [Shouchella clausii]|jgi:cystathionine beta-lyase/cystathionine gamma-synthase|uniref:Aminotransferase n=4 Tax=Bacillaceae TaxID=186817 RepID=Q5WK90_SHOC1|nr:MULTISPECIES: aminotransferase class V-fold PLP-dependent enzyme [Shouchella]MCM3314054.1 aminotransferase class V-fold PLP-dependent enzyme [Psychrobacillus sp. MER TA 17]SPU21332.1 aluminum resistance protein [Niallia circulans]ALA52175.1 Aspartate aminotransferase family [Shouchella clausii]MBU3230384.1 aminotransferase class V-fold PLP-dependent enzyme [Shouchella clausii]MBU3262417.1 aminotransferase class V-fold PLP-dependent enzyme [Shouchella clausii]